MLDKIAFQLPGHPKGKGRPRAARRGNFVTLYTPAETRSYEGMIRLAAERAMRGRLPIEGPVIMMMAAVFDVPKGYSKKRRAVAIESGEFPTKKPDLDNIAKVVVDAMNGVVFKDDCQIVSTRYSKVYGLAPMVAVTVTPL